MRGGGEGEALTRPAPGRRVPLYPAPLAPCVGPIRGRSRPSPRVVPGPHRWPAARDFQTVEIEGHIIGVKVTSGRAKIEHDDAVRAAQALGVPLREILSLAEEAWRHE